VQPLRQGNTGQIITQWQRSVDSKEALYMLCQEMHLAPHRRIVMAVKIAHVGGTFVCCRRFFHLTNSSAVKYHNYSHYKLTSSCTIVDYKVFILFVYHGGPPTAMVDGGRAIVVIDREAVEINLLLVKFII